MRSYATHRNSGAEPHAKPVGNLGLGSYQAEERTLTWIFIVSHQSGIDSTMSIQKSPHTQSEQNIPFEQTDLDPDLERRLAAGDESQLPARSEGAQIGGTRSPRRAPKAGPEHKTEAPVAAFEGSTKTRTNWDPRRQGISSRSSAEESRGQRKVVRARDDAKAGVSHSGKKHVA